jgi:hypothetical protein
MRLVEAGCRIRAGMEDRLIYTDERVQEYLKAHNFVYEEPQLNLMRLSTDERLSNIEGKMETAQNNPLVTLQEQSSKILSIMRTFLSRYRVGFLHDIHINKYGTIEVEIPCLIMPETPPKEYSPRATFEAQLNFLRQHGFVLDKAKAREVALINTPNNQQLLRDLFTSRGAKNVVLSVREDCIDRVSFLVKLQDIENFRCEPILVPNEKGQYLSDEEFRTVTRLCGEILFAMDFVETSPGMANTVYGLIENYFADICEIYQYEGVSFKNVKARYAAERAKNEHIRKMEQAVEVMDYEKIHKGLNHITETLNEELIRATGFALDKFEINQYGSVDVSFHYMTSPLLWCIPNEEVENSLRKHFTLTDGDMESETLYISMTEDNLATLEKLIREIIPSFMALNVTAQKRPRMVISTISGVVDNIAPLVERIMQQEGGV